MTERMVTQRMIYLLDIKNRLAAIAKDMSIVSNQQSAISNGYCLHHLARRFFVLPEDSSCLLSRERL